GLQERWGQTVLHCPYCHGYEVAGRPLGVLAAHPLSAHQAVLLPDWGPTTYFTQGEFEPDAEQAALLDKRGVRIERKPIVELMGTAPALDAVKLADGRRMAVHALFVASKTHMASPLAMQLGCAFDDGPLGPVIRTDEFRQTTVPGVYAAGDAAIPMSNATLASASGVMAGVCVHRALVMA
ncbi:MAG: FAD-dependent oxidoreductase, partial [Achromobacter sp.]